MRYIDSFTDNMHISGIYLCVSKNTQKTKNGKDYWNMILQYKTGNIPTKIWDIDQPGIEEFDAPCFVEIEGDTNPFNGILQLIVRRIRVADEGSYDPAEYVPTTDKDVNAMCDEIKKFIESVKEPHLHKLLSMIFIEDNNYFEKFKSATAAKRVHHGYVGGLLEHTLGVVKLCDYLANAYRGIDRDLLISAALCHDIGKVDEMTTLPECDYTDEGQMIGHIIIGYRMIAEKIALIDGFPERLRNNIEHCILAHHGEYEFGSPKKPAIMEAMVLNLADNTDAKIEIMNEALDKARDDSWLGMNRFLDSNIRRT